MRDGAGGEAVELDLASPVWDRVFTVAPLVVVGTREGDGYDLAPKHMATPLGRHGHFGFVCTAAHGTYHNAKAHGVFTVSYPGPEQVVVTGLSAAPREVEGGPTPGLDSLPTEAARRVEGRVLRDAVLVLECELERVVDGFGEDSLVIGRIVAARARADALRVSEVEDETILRRAPVLAYLEPGRFAAVAESRAFPYPAGFRR